jgi:hypothetical protein
MRGTERCWAELAGQVKKRREYLGLGQADLGVSDLTLRKVEQGHGEGLRAKTLRQIENCLRWRPGTVDRILDGTATTEDLLGGFGVLWLQNISGGPLVIERPVPDADTLTVESMGIVQVVGAVAEALRDEYRTEHHDRQKSWPTAHWKLIRYDQPGTVPELAGTTEVMAPIAAGGEAAVSNLTGTVPKGGGRGQDSPGMLGGNAVAQMSVELLGQLVLQPQHTPAEERLIHSLLAVVAERSGATVAYTTGAASITMTTVDSATGAPVTQTLHAGKDI